VIRRIGVNRAITIGMSAIAGALALRWFLDWYPDRPAWVEPVKHYIIHVGLKTTLEIAAISVVGSAVIGVLLGTLLTIRFRPSRFLIRAYVEIWRGLPIVITMFIVYFALPDPFPELSAFKAATIGLILWGSAQVAEATRGAVQSIPREQHQAASALGFGWVGTHAFVILPQAFRRLIPPMVGLLVNVVQNTTVAALLGVAESLETGNRSVERLLYTTGESHAFAIFGFVMVIFFVISFPLTRLAAYLERKLV